MFQILTKVVHLNSTILIFKGTWLAYNDSGVSSIEFEKRGGVVLFQLLNRRSIVDGLDIVKVRKYIP